ncbi:MAG: hypothetical protein Q4G66_00940 [bacterium]|nr:hypothetical protein [bacterium]
MTAHSSCSRDSSRRQPSGGAGKRRAQAGITCDPLLVNSQSIKVHRGIDTLKVSFYADWDDLSEYESLLDTKELLQATEFELSAPIEIGFLKFNLHRSGVRFYPLRLTCGDITLLLSKTVSTASRPTIRLEIGSLTSQTALLNTIGAVKVWFEQNGIEIVREVVSEVHLAADFIGQAIEPLDLTNEDLWIYKAVTFTVHRHNRRLSGVSIGKGDIMLRVYDKVLELQRSHHKQEVFSDLWGVPYSKELNVTRVEYQLRRPVLKDFINLEHCKEGVITVDDLLKGLQALWQYCTIDWARFVKTLVDRDNNNQSQALISDFWEVVRSVVWESVYDLRRTKKIKYKNITALRAQARGIMMSIASFFVRDPEDIEEVVSRSTSLLEADLREFYKDEEQFIKRMYQKQNECVLDAVPF